MRRRPGKSKGALGAKGEITHGIFPGNPDSLRSGGRYGLFGGRMVVSPAPELLEPLTALRIENLETGSVTNF